MPKYIIISFVLAVIVFSVIRLAIKSSTHHFVCSECGKSFQVNFFKFFFTAHSPGGYCGVTCPECGKHNMLQAIKGKE